MPRTAIHEQLLMVKLSPALKRRLKRAAAKQHTDMSKLTREAIVEHLERLDQTARARGDDSTHDGERDDPDDD